jgi:hypothetical protein
MSYADKIIEDRRLLLLKALANSLEFTASDLLLISFLRSMGHVSSHDSVLVELAWLQEQRLVELSNESKVCIATLTLRGLDAAGGSTRVPGIRLPRPGE